MPNDEDIGKLKTQLDIFLNVLLALSVNPTILQNYNNYFALFGFKLLAYITEDFGKLFNTTIFKLFQLTINKVLNGENFTNGEVHTLLQNFYNAVLTGEQIIGLMVLLMTPIKKERRS